MQNITLPEIEKINNREKLIFWGFYLIYAVYFLLNFLGSPLLKNYFLFTSAYLFFMSLIIPVNKVYIPLIALLFIEGQGKIMLGYNTASRMIFDALILLFIARVYIKERKFSNYKHLSVLFKVALILHFLWYFLQIFNIYSVDFYSSIVTAKIYIIPLLLFLAFIACPLDKKEDLEQMKIFFLVLFITQCLLIIYQMNMGDQFIIGISKQYDFNMGLQFRGILYRPYGTSYRPGAAGYYLFIFTGLLLLTPTKNQIMITLTQLSLALLVPALFLCQVRATMIKYFVILFIIIIGGLFINRKSLSKYTKSSFIILFTLFSIYHIFDFDKKVKELNLDIAIQRFTSLSEQNTLTSNRLGFNNGVDILVKKLTRNPFGLGTGRTGAALNISKDKIINDPVYNLKDSWSYDNLLISLAIDFGFGMIFYTILITYMPLYLMINLYRSFKRRDTQTFRSLLIVAPLLTILYIMNWGAIGIPYQPESFAYWFWAAYGFNIVLKSKKEFNQNPELSQ